MRDKIRNICLSKVNILAVALSTFAFLKDIQELITSFASHLVVVGLTVLVLISLLLINLFLSKSDIGESEDELIVDNKSTNNNYKPSVLNNPSKKYMSLFPKIIFSSIIFFTLMTAGSLYYIKNMGVFYVVLKSDLTKRDAIWYKELTNKSAEFVQQGFSSRFIPIANGKYQLILYNGYVNENRANADLEKVQAMKMGLNPYKIGPQNVASYFKKVKYLQHHVFN